MRGLWLEGIDRIARRRRGRAAGRAWRWLVPVRGRRGDGSLEAGSGAQPSNVRRARRLKPYGERASRPLAASSKQLRAVDQKLDLFVLRQRRHFRRRDNSSPPLARRRSRLRRRSPRRETVSSGSYRPRAVAALVNDRGERLTIEMLAGRHLFADDFLDLLTARGRLPPSLAAASSHPGSQIMGMGI